MLGQHDSATLALEAWCCHPLVALPLEASLAPCLAPEVITPALACLPHETIRARHVRLCCDGRTVAIASNWYVPERLTPVMNALLASTDTPFGRVVAPLNFRRTLLDSQSAARDDAILTHHALLTMPDRRPLAYVIECYRPAVLQF